MKIEKLDARQFGLHETVLAEECGKEGWLSFVKRSILQKNTIWELLANNLVRRRIPDDGLRTI